MSDNDRSREGVSDKNCNSCRWAQWGEAQTHSWGTECKGECAYPMPAVMLRGRISDSEVGAALGRMSGSPRTTGTNCPTWQAKESAAKAERGVTCIGCELADDCPGFRDCPKLAAAKAEGDKP